MLTHTQVTGQVTPSQVNQSQQTVRGRTTYNPIIVRRHMALSETRQAAVVTYLAGKCLSGSVDGTACLDL